MTITLATLTAERSLGLRLVAGDAEVPVTWVHSSDLVDPTPFLEPGNLLLTTGSQLPAEGAAGADIAAYVDRLAAAGVPALGFGAGVVRALPEDLVVACRAASVALVEVPYRTPFLAVVRHLADVRAEQAHARDLWALDAQRALSLAALRATRSVAVLDELGRRLDAQVMLLDARGDLVAEHGGRPLTGVAFDEVRRQARRTLQRRQRAGASLELAGLVVAMQTLGRRDELRGVLAVAMRERPDRAARAVITGAVALAEFAAEDEARGRDTALVLHEQLFRLCLAGQVEAAGAVLAAAGRELPEPPLRLVLAQPGDSADAAELDRAATTRLAAAGGATLGCRWGRRYAAVCHDADAGALRDALSGAAVVMSAATGWSGLGAALHQAGVVLDAAGPGATVTELSASPLLGLLTRAELRPLARSRLAALDGVPDGAELRRTLTVWLRYNAAWEPAARELGRHRHTLKSQIGRAGELLDLDLDTFEAKAELWALLAATS